MLDNHISRLILPLGLSAICVSSIACFQFSRLGDISANNQRKGSSSNYHLDDSRQAASIRLFKKFPTFGFDNLVADWAFLSYLQYFGDRTARKSTGYNLSPDFFDVLVSHDPRFISPYYFLSTSTSLYAGQPDRSVELMEKALQSLSPQSDPNAYLVWLYKATDELLFLGDNKSARNSYQKVVEWAQANGDLESQRLSSLSARTARFLANKPNSKSAQIDAWLLVFVNAVDDVGRQRALENIKRLGGEIFFRENGGVSVKHPIED